MRFQSGIVDQVIYFVAVDSTDLKTRETGLTSFTVYRARNGGAATAYTTPTVTEVSSANMPGVYSLLLDEDMTIDAGDDSQAVVLHITQASMAPVTLMYELYRPIVTAGQTATVTSGGVTLADGVSHGGTLGSSTATLALSRLNITSQTSNTTALTVTGNGTGNGATFTSGAGATGDGVQMNSGATNGNGLTVDGNGTGHGLSCVAGATGNGLRVAGGATSGAGVLVSTTSGDGISSTPTAGHALNLTANGTTKHGINATGGATTSHGAVFTGGGVGHGILATSGSGATGNGISAVAASTNGSGMTLTKTGSGSDFNATSTPLTLAKTTNITGFNDIAATAIVSSGAITTSGGAVSTVTTVTNQLTAAQIATGVWQDTTAGDFTVASSIGKSLYTTGNAPGAASGLAIVGSNMGTVTSVTGAVGSVTGNVGGSVGSVTAGVTVTTNNDKTGYSLSAAGIQAIWDALTSALTTVGSIGKRIVDNLDATISSRLATSGYTAPPSAASNASAVRTELTTELGRIDVATSTRLASASYTAPLDAAGTRTAMGLASANLDTQLADLPTANENADALLDRAAGVETNRTLRQALRLMLAAMCGKVSGASTTTVTIRDTNDGVNRIVATVDADGNRSAVTLDAS
jgi:hypothetical protein